MTASPHSAVPAPDLHRLRIQLATLLAAIENLRQEREATVELARHLRSQQHQPADTATVLADLEAIMRASACSQSAPGKPPPQQSYCP